jgi:hypothetical protein
MTDTPMDTAAAELAELLAKLPGDDWYYRPDKFDDWGIIRGGVANEYGLPFIGQIRPSYNTGEDILAAHRAANTDPWEDEARFVVLAKNRLPALLTERAEMKARIAALEGEKAIMKESLGKICEHSNPEWTEKRIYPLDVLDDIHRIAVDAYYDSQPDAFAKRADGLIEGKGE